MQSSRTADEIPGFAAARGQFAERGTVLLFIGRFISGRLNLSGLLAGSSGMSLRRFVPVSAAAAVAWATFNGLQYYFFGHALLGAGTWVRVVMVCAGVAWIAVSFTVLRRWALRQVGPASAPAAVAAEALAGPSTPARERDPKPP